MERGKIDAEAELSLPPGFRFHPTDEELVVHYLCRKAAHQRLPVPIIADVDLYKYDPWDLPERALFGQREWYFFTPRDRKYPNGSRPNRAAGRGYWKATGADKPVSTVGPTDRPIAIKKALVFYHGKAPKGVKTDWIMHEYRLANVNRAATNKKGSLRLDEWVLCRLYNKKNSWEKKAPLKREDTETMETSEDTRSESLRTPESDVDHDHHEQFPDFHDMGNLQYFPAAASNVMEAPKSNGFPRLGQVKEDSDWFVGLQLDDLQSSLMDFGSSDDYYFPALDSPHLMPPL